MKKSVLFFILTVVITVNVFAYSDEEEYLIWGASLSTQLIWESQYLFLHKENWDLQNHYPYYLDSILLAQHIPLYSLDPGKGLFFSGLGLLATGSYFASNIFHWPLVYQYFFKVWNIKQAMFSSFEIYRTIKPDTHQNLPYTEILFAPYLPETLLHPMNLIIAGSLGASFSLFYLFSDYKGYEIWNRKKTLFLDQEVSPVESMLLLLGSTLHFGMEEAYWRGMVYEELAGQLGSKWGSAVTASALFSLWHLPTENFLQPPDILRMLGSFAAYFCGGLLFTYAYELGGVPLAGAVHSTVVIGAGLLFNLFFSGADIFSPSSEKKEEDSVVLEIGPASAVLRIRL